MGNKNGVLVRVISYGTIPTAKNLIQPTPYKTIRFDLTATNFVPGVNLVVWLRWPLCESVDVSSVFSSPSSSSRGMVVREDMVGFISSS